MDVGADTSYVRIYMSNLICWQHNIGNRSEEVLKSQSFY